MPLPRSTAQLPPFGAASNRSAAPPSKATLNGLCSAAVRSRHASRRRRAPGPEPDATVPNDLNEVLLGPVASHLSVVPYRRHAPNDLGSAMPVVTLLPVQIRRHLIPIQIHRRPLYVCRPQPCSPRAHLSGARQLLRHRVPGQDAHRRAATARLLAMCMSEHCERMDVDAPPPPSAPDVAIP